MPASNERRTEEPDTPVNVAANTAIEAARLSLDDDGLLLDRAVVVLYSEAATPNATVAFHLQGEHEVIGDDPLDQVLKSAVEAYYRTTGRAVSFVEVEGRIEGPHGEDLVTRVAGMIESRLMRIEDAERRQPHGGRYGECKALARDIVEMFAERGTT